MYAQHNNYQIMGISDKVFHFVNQAEESILPIFQGIDSKAEFNQMKVLHALQKHKVSDMHFNWNTGYGYDDSGREVVEKVYATAFGAEDALVRPIIVSGTHALTLMLTGILRPNQKILSITGKPYDTLLKVIGIEKSTGFSLMDMGVQYDSIELLKDGSFDMASIIAQELEKVDVLYIQRSAGYSWRKGLSIKDIQEVIHVIKSVNPQIKVLVDNCYGEFLEDLEPVQVGADLMAGSLIKNPGGGLALSGGYIAGKEELVDQVAQRLTSPGIGKECGLMFGQTRSMLQGFFMAPTVVASAVKGAVLCAQVFSNLGYEVNPKPQDLRSDIIQAVQLGDSKKVIAFCQGIQKASPVDSFVTPEPWAMPGYSSDVIMAAGAFVQGSSIELSADAPIRAPYNVYFQGGLTYTHAKIGVMSALENMINQGFQSIEEDIHEL